MDERHHDPLIDRPAPWRVVDGLDFKIVDASGATVLARDYLRAGQGERIVAAVNVDLAAFAAGLKAHLRKIDPDDIAREVGGGMGSPDTGWMHGDMVIDWGELDKAIDAFAAEFQRSKG